MSFFSKLNSGFENLHVLVEVMSNSIIFSILLAKGRSYGKLASVSIEHQAMGGSDFLQKDIQKLDTVLSKGFTGLRKAVEIKIGKKYKDGSDMKIKSSTVILYSPWFSVKKEVNLAIGNKEQKNFVTKKSIELALSQFESRGEALEMFVDEIKLNGYRVSNPIGKKVEHVSVSAFFYLAPKKLTDCITKEINFHTSTSPKILTSPKSYALFALRHAMKLPALFICVENQRTSVVQVSEGNFLSDFPCYTSQTIDFGLNQLVEILMKKSGIDKQMAFSYLRLLNDDMLADRASLMTKSARDEGLEIWKSKINSLALRGNKKFLLCREPKFSEIFIKTLGRDFSRDINSEQITFESCFFDV